MYAVRIQMILFAVVSLSMCGLYISLFLFCLSFVTLLRWFIAMSLLGRNQ